MRDKHQVIEEPCEFKGSSTVLKTSEFREELAEFTRSAHDAIASIYNLARPNKRKKWVVDADIQGCFDNISHNFLLELLTGFPARELIKQWLLAGYMEAGS